MAENWWDDAPLEQPEEDQDWWSSAPVAEDSPARPAAAATIAPAKPSTPVADALPDNPEGTGFGRAIKRGIIRAGSTFPAMDASRGLNRIEDATTGFGTPGEMQQRALALREEADALEVEIQNLDDPDVAESVRDEIAYLRRRADTLDTGASTPSMKAVAERAVPYVEAQSRRVADAIGRLRELNAKAAAIPYSPGARAAQERLVAAPDTVRGTLSALAQRPLETAAFLGEIATESTPMIMGSIVAGVVSRNPTLAAAVLGAGAMTQEYGASVDEFLTEQGVSMDSQEAAAQILSDPEIMREASRRGLRRGLVIAAAEMLGQGATTAITRTTGPITGAVASTGVQAATGGGGEAAAMAAAGQDLSAREIILEAVAETVTAPLEIGAAVVSDRADSSRLTPSDRKSPIQNDVIDDGKAILDNLINGGPVVGTTVDTPPASRASPTMPGAPSQPDTPPVPPATTAPPEVPQGAVSMAELYPTAQEQSGAPTGFNDRSPAAEPGPQVSAPSGDQAPVAPQAGLTPDVKMPDPFSPTFMEEMDALYGQTTDGQQGFNDPALATDQGQRIQAPAPDTAPPPVDDQSWYKAAEIDESDMSTGQTPGRSEVEAVAAEAEAAPTDAQKKAENYKKGHTRWNGLEISIENAKGSERFGTDGDGETWSVTMPAHYGYVKKTEGADGDHVDVYIGDHPKSDFVAVVDQVDHKTGEFDEHKVILGTLDQAEAERLYQGGFSDGFGFRRMGAVTTMTVEEFKAWVRDGDTSKPLGQLPERAKVTPEEVDADTAENRRGAINRLHKMGVYAPLISPMAKPFTNEFTGDMRIDPTGEAAEELASMGITPRTAPRIFKKGGLGALDNLSLSEFRSRYPDAKDDGSGNYVDQQWIFDQLGAEAAGMPRPSIDQQRIQDENDAWLDAVEAEMRGDTAIGNDDTPKEIEIIPPRNDDPRTDDERTADVRRVVDGVFESLGIADVIDQADRGAIITQMVRDGGEVYDAIYDRAYSLITAAQRDLPPVSEGDTIPFGEEEITAYETANDNATQTARQEPRPVDARPERDGQPEGDARAEGQGQQGGQVAGSDAREVTATPTFEQFRAALPADSEGFADVTGAGQAAIDKAAGDTGRKWADLSDAQKKVAYQVFGGDLASLPAAERTVARDQDGDQLNLRTPEWATYEAAITDAQKLDDASYDAELPRLQSLHNKAKASTGGEIQTGEYLSPKAAKRMAARQAKTPKPKVAALRRIAEGAIKKADETLNQDRQTNTARRARMAGNAIGAATAQKRNAETALKIADVIEANPESPLATIKSIKDIERIETALRGAQYKRIRAEGGRVDKAGPVAPEDVDYVGTPEVLLRQGEVQEILNDTKGMRGVDRRTLNTLNTRSTETYYYAKGRDVDAVEGALKVLRKKQKLSYGQTNLASDIRDYHAMKRIVGDGNPRAVYDAYFEARSGTTVKVDPVKAAREKLIGVKIPGFFETTEILAKQMVDLAGLEPGQVVLEPSAGLGRIASAAAEIVGKENVDLIEVNATLRENLEAQGFNLVGRDFMEFEPTREYDAVIMNPPFETRQDAEHVMRAFDMVKPGGRVVAIMGEGVFFGSDKKAVAFREWLEAKGGTSEKLPEGSFKESGTGVNARLVQIPVEVSISSSSENQGANAERTTERTEAGEQQVIPGAEQSQERSDDARKADQRREVEARARQSRMGTTTPQDAPGGLFDTQGDMFDAPAPQAAPKKAERILTENLRKEWEAREALPDDEAGQQAFVEATPKVTAAREALAAEVGAERSNEILEQIETEYTPPSVQERTDQEPVKKDGVSKPKDGSWIAIRRESGEVIGEFQTEKAVEKLDPATVAVIPAKNYLARYNRRVRNGGATDAEFFKAMAADFPAGPARIADLDPRKGYDAYRNMSMSPERRANSDIEGYVQAVNGFYGEMGNLAKTEQQRAVLDSAIQEYRRRYIGHMNAMWAASSRTVSSMVTGGSNFPVARNRKRLDTYDRRVKEFLEWEGRAKASIRQEISDARPDEVKAEDAWKTVEKQVLSIAADSKAAQDGDFLYDLSLFKNNFYNRMLTLARSGNVSLVDRMLERLKTVHEDFGAKKPVFTDRHKIWKLGDIARANSQRSAANLEADDTVIATYDGATITNSPADERVRIEFDERVSREVATDLKKEGWRWSPKNTAWQRKNTPNAERSAKRIVGRHFTETSKERRGPATDALAPVMADLRAALDKMGLKRVKLEVAPDMASQAAFRATGADIRILIGASLDPKASLRHEAIHALRAMDLFTAKEWDALTQEAERIWRGKYEIGRRYGDLDAEAQIEEAIAEAFADYKGRAPNNLIQAAFAKVKRFLKALGGVLSGRGITSAEDIFADVAEGRVGARDTGGDVAAMAAERTNTSTKAFKEWFGDSKVVDGLGDPATVYHGTAHRNYEAPFEAFNGMVWASEGAKLAFDYGSTRQSMIGASGQFRLIEAYMRIERPFDADLGLPRSVTIGDMTTAIIEQAEEQGRVLTADQKSRMSELVDTLQDARVREESGPHYSRHDFWNESAMLFGRDGAAAIQEMFELAGFDGVKMVEDGQQTWGAFSPTQIKSVNNRGTFDPADPRILYQRQPATPEQERDNRAAGAFVGEDVQNGVTDATGPQERQESLVRAVMSQPIDQVFRIPFHVAGGLDKFGRWTVGKKAESVVRSVVLDKKFRDGGAFESLNPMLYRVRAGIIDRYGLPEAYVETDRRRALDEAAIATEGKEHLAALAAQDIGVEEARVLQAVLTGDSVPMGDMAKIAAPIRKAIDDLGAEAVELGLISRESYERNRGTYLHRVYEKHEADATTLGKWASGLGQKRRRQIIGNQFKGRGIFEEVASEDIWTGIKDFHDAKFGQPSVGDGVLIFDQIDNASEALPGLEGAKPRTVKRVYWPANKPVPARLKGYVNRGEFEVRGKRGGQLVLWRDFQKDERLKMGEILDARYTIGKTFQLMAQDLATGRFFKKVAENEEWAKSTPPEGAKVDADPRESGAGREFAKRMWVDPSLEWVKVPDSKVPNTNTLRYGALAGKWVRADIWRDMEEMRHMQTPGWWRALLTQWKLNKTARSPVVHMNNVMSNFTLMDMADVRTPDLIKAVREMAKGGKLYTEATDNGAFGTDFVTHEIQRQVLDPILTEILKDSMGGKSSLRARLGLIGAIGDGLAGGVKYLDGKMVNAYQMEDNIFRLATYIRRREQGMTAEEAAIEARDQFLNYDIRAPWINAVRGSVLPFISYTYRAVPKVAQTVAERPWKIMKYVAMYQAFNMLSYALAPSEWDEEEERKSLMEQEQGFTWVGSERMVRLPALDRNGNPVFMDVRRWIPAGDVFDTQGDDIPAWLQLGGPLMLGMELYLNKSAFFDQPIVNKITDTASERAAKRASHLYQSWMPSAPWIPKSWYWEKIGRAAGGEARQWGSNEPYSMGEALASSVGIKIKPKDVEVGYQLWGIRFDQVERELKFQAKALQRQRKRRLISDDAYKRGIASIREKMARLNERRRETFP